MTICLNMIVKNESGVIRRCLESVKQLIDYWVIVDTGSTDGTQTFIRETLKEIPGELYERPWVNFSHNRNEALKLAREKGDYLLLIDADETLLISGTFDKETLEKDFYLFWLKERSSTDLYRVSLIKNLPEWYWEGVLHENLTASTVLSGEVLKTIVKDGSTKDGWRSKNPNKHLQDAAILEADLKENPQNSRSVFYLAQSYGNGGQFERAIELYEQRTKMGGDPEEVFWSFYCAGLLHQHIQSPPSVVIESYAKANQNRPKRAEPLYQMGEYFYQRGFFSMSYLLTQPALSFKVPQSGNYFHSWVYEYGTLLTFSNSARAMGYTEEALNGYRELERRDLPLQTRIYVENQIVLLS